MKWNRAKFQAENDHRYESVAGECCVYCGDKAVLLDHVPSLYEVFKKGFTPEAKVACCWTCNELLGARGGSCLSDRMSFLHSKAGELAEASGDIEHLAAIQAATELTWYFKFEVTEYARLLSGIKTRNEFLQFMDEANDLASKRMSEFVEEVTEHAALNYGPLERM